MDEDEPVRLLHHDPHYDADDYCICPCSLCYIPEDDACTDIECRCKEDTRHEKD